MAEKKTKVLVVEDDKFLTNIYEVKLTNEGFNVKIAVNGEDGLKAVEDFKPDVILLDLILPKLSGFEFLEELKGKQRSEIPVVVLSNLGQEEDVQRAKKLGALDYLVKATTPIKEVVAKIKTVVK